VDGDGFVLGYFAYVSTILRVDFEIVLTMSYFFIVFSSYYSNIYENGSLFNCILL